jgi:hypothetical protein
MGFSVFASYSREDAHIVAPLVQLLRSAGPHVFRDEDDIHPGKRWQPVIAKALQDCRVVLVFWSANAAASDAVRTEYTRGIRLGKRIVPVLLDATLMTPELAAYQAVRLNGFLVGEGTDRSMRDAARIFVRLWSEYSESATTSEDLTGEPES